MDRTRELRRHGDDLRSLLRNLGEAQDVEGLIRSEVRFLGLPIDNDKTRTLRRDTDLERRQEVAEGVRGYLEAHDVADQDNRIYALLGALWREFLL